MDTFKKTKAPQCQSAVFRVFPSWDSALCTDEAPPNQDSGGQKAERNLAIEICVDGYDENQFTTKAEKVIRKLQERWFEQKLESQFLFDEADVSAKRWGLCMVYFEAFAQGCREQSKEQLDRLIYENHLHNAQRRHDSLLQHLQRKQLKAAQKGDVINPEHWMSQRYALDLDLAKIQGEYLGRELVDKFRPDLEPLPLPLTVGDICVTLSPRNHCAASSLILDEMPGPNHPKIPISRSWQYQQSAEFKNPGAEARLPVVLIPDMMISPVAE
jgi:hypothetical protein